MTEDRLASFDLIDQSTDDDLVRDMLAFAAGRIMEMEVEACATGLFAASGTVLGKIVCRDWPDHQHLIGAWRAGKGGAISCRRGWPRGGSPLVLDVKGERGGGDRKKCLFRQATSRVMRRLITPSRTRSPRASGCGFIILPQRYG